MSDVVRDLGVDEGYSFGDPAVEELKGFSEPATIYELLGYASSA